MTEQEPGMAAAKVYTPTAAEVIAQLVRAYGPPGAALMRMREATLGGVAPESLMETPEGRRRVYCWARGLADAVAR